MLLKQFYMREQLLNHSKVITSGNLTIIGTLQPRNILMIACENDVDESPELSDFDSQNNNIIGNIEEENPHVDNDSNFVSGASQIENDDTTTAVACDNLSTQNGIRS